jgi:hypothetical protein
MIHLSNKILLLVFFIVLHNNPDYPVQGDNTGVTKTGGLPNYLLPPCHNRNKETICQCKGIRVNFLFPGSILIPSSLSESSPCGTSRQTPEPPKQAGKAHRTSRSTGSPHRLEFINMHLL